MHGVTKFYFFSPSACREMQSDTLFPVMQISENLFNGENFEGSKRSENKREKLACQPS